MIEITMDSVFETAAKVVAGREDYVYTNPRGAVAGSGVSTNCLYVHPSGPGCIVGSILHDMGVNLYDMQKCEGDDARGLLERLQREEIIAIDALTINALQVMQSSQDCGTPWGEAVRTARRASLSN